MSPQTPPAGFPDHSSLKLQSVTNAASSALLRMKGFQGVRRSGRTKPRPSMRQVVVSMILYGLLVRQTTIAQAAGLTTPDCGILCLQQQGPGSCPSTALNCTCHEQDWVSSVLACIGKTCNATDAATAQIAFEDTCANATAAWTTTTPLASPTAAPSRPNKTGVFVAIAVGGFAGVLALVGFIVIVYWRILKRRDYLKRLRNVDGSKNGPYYGDDVGLGDRQQVVQMGGTDRHTERSEASGASVSVPHFLPPPYWS